MADKYTTMGGALIAFNANQPPTVEQVNNWVLTGLGHDAAGNDNSHKWVQCGLGLPLGVPVIGTGYLLVGITDPVGMEKVANVALTYTPPS